MYRRGFVPNLHKEIYLYFLLRVVFRNKNYCNLLQGTSVIDIFYIRFFRTEIMGPDRGIKINRNQQPGF